MVARAKGCNLQLGRFGTARNRNVPNNLPNGLQSEDEPSITLNQSDQTAQ